MVLSYKQTNKQNRKGVFAIFTKNSQGYEIFSQGIAEKKTSIKTDTEIINFGVGKMNKVHYNSIITYRSTLVSLELLVVIT